MDKSFINDLDYTKRYLRCIQISEILSSMKDLIDYSKKYGIGPAEAMAMIHRESRVAHNSVGAEGVQPHIDESQNSSVISFAPPYPSSDEATGSLNCCTRATSPTSASTANSSKRLLHQEDLAEPKRKKQIIITNSGENSVLHAPPPNYEPVLNQPTFTTPPPSADALNEKKNDKL